MRYNPYSIERNTLLDGSRSCLDTVREFLRRIEEKKHLNIFLEIFSEEALKLAASLDSKIKNNVPVGRLAGMVVAIKDNLCYAGHRVSASSRILEGFESLYSSTAVERLLAEDAIIIGRTNCDEFAMGSSNENSAFGPVLNPLDESLVPGGSSGGSAAAVAAGLCHTALGSDTGGSIRQPASFCGVIGLRPTYGRISRHGLLAFASSLDQIGTVSHNIEDASILLEIISGADEFDSTVSQKKVPAYSKELHNGQKLNVAYLDDCIRLDGVDDEIEDRIFEILAALENDG
ncbi:MAG: amidase family protein, partial [Bacteroidota bacterium]|nr:amidase family protein [Bacteroidota bacterium]